MKNDSRKLLKRKLKQLRAEFEERKAAIPIHSIRPHQMIKLEELEEEIKEIERKLDQAQSPPAG